MEIHKSSSQYQNNQSFAYIAIAIALLIIITYVSQLLPESLTIFAIPIILGTITLYIVTIAYQFRKSQERMPISQQFSEN